jgi:hypothetical protein
VHPIDHRSVSVSRISSNAAIQGTIMTELKRLKCVQQVFSRSEKVRPIKKRGSVATAVDPVFEYLICGLFAHSCGSNLTSGWDI